MALGLGTAAIAFCLSLLVTAVVSACTEARPEAELTGLVHSLAERPPAHAANDGGSGRRRWPRRFCWRRLR